LGSKEKEHAMSSKHDRAVASVIGIDIGKNSFHIIGQDQRGAIVLRQKWSRGQVEARLANVPPCFIGMEACVGAHHLSRKLQALPPRAVVAAVEHHGQVDEATRHREEAPLIDAENLFRQPGPPHWRKASDRPRPCLTIACRAVRNCRESFYPSFRS
jgi:hypothetical protein